MRTEPRDRKRMPGSPTTRPMPPASAAMPGASPIEKTPAAMKHKGQESVLHCLHFLLGVHPLPSTATWHATCHRATAHN